MKKSVIIAGLTIFLTSIILASIKKMPLEQLHNWARGYKIVKYSVRGASKKLEQKRQKKVAINYSARRVAILELRRRKNPKSIEVLTEVSTEGLNIRYSPKGKPGSGREGLSARAQSNLRMLGLFAIKNFKGVEMNDVQKKMIKRALRTVLLEGYSQRNRALACENLGLHKNILTKNEMDFYNEYFRREALRTVKMRQYRLLYAMFYATSQFNQKSGVKFLNRALASGIRGKSRSKAMQIRQKLISQGEK